MWADVGLVQVEGPSRCEHRTSRSSLRWPRSTKTSLLTPKRCSSEKLPCFPESLGYSPTKLFCSPELFSLTNVLPEDFDLNNAVTFIELVLEHTTDKIYSYATK